VCSSDLTTLAKKPEFESVAEHLGEVVRIVERVAGERDEREAAE
jgi:hypothetical protein